LKSFVKARFNVYTCISVMYPCLGQVFVDMTTFFYTSSLLFRLLTVDVLAIICVVVLKKLIIVREETVDIHTISLEVLLKTLLLIVFNTKKNKKTCSETTQRIKCKGVVEC